MSDIWYEEELAPTEQTLEELANHVKRLDLPEAVRTSRAIQAQVRLYTPIWQRLADTSQILTSTRGAAFYQVRLGFEVEIARQAREDGARFTFALCTAYLWSASNSQVQPSVYDLYPAYLDEGQQRVISVEFGPELKVGEVGGSLGKLSTDVHLGQVEPLITGWKGKGEREPHWELNPQSKTLLGQRHLWLLIQAPEECDGVRLAVQVEGDVQMYWGILPVGPKERVWDKRKSVLIR